MAPKPLSDMVVLVLDAAAELGRALSLELSARGAAVVCAGPVEREVARVVGEVVYGGGRARHRVVDLGDAEAIAAARAFTVATFGQVDLVLAGSDAAVGHAPAAPLDGDLDARARALAEGLVGARSA